MRGLGKNCGEQHKKVISETEVREDVKNIANFIRLVNAQLRYYMHINEPDLLSDDEWASRFNELIWIRKKENDSK